MLGIGIDTSVASYDEMQNAINQQEDIENSIIDETKAKALTARCVSEQVPVEKILKFNKVNAIEELTMKQYANIHANWNKIKGN